MVFTAVTVHSVPGMLQIKRRREVMYNLLSSHNRCTLESKIWVKIAAKSGGRNAPPSTVTVFSFCLNVTSRSEMRFNAKSNQILSDPSHRLEGPLCPYFIPIRRYCRLASSGYGDDVHVCNEEYLKPESGKNLLFLFT